MTDNLDERAVREVLKRLLTGMAARDKESRKG